MASALSKDECEAIVYQRDFQHDDVARALKLVEKFIKQRKRILVGGMAIDMSLRTKGKSLYPADKFPDFDLYSPEFHIDAYMLGNILAEEFDGISVIRAYHISTMKVRINFQELADITYIPQAIYDRIPTITHDGFRVIHPHFQMADQHRALSLPYEKPPQETIFGRWKKDLERYDILANAFPIGATSKATKKSTHATREVKLPAAVLENNCLGGITAGIYWQMLAAHYGRPAGLPLGHIEWHKKTSALICKLPAEHRAWLITDDYSLVQRYAESNSWGPSTYVHATLDKIRRRVVYEKAGIELVDNLGNLLGAAMRSEDLLGATAPFHVVNLQDVCCAILTEAALCSESDPARHAQLHAEYAELIDIVRWAAKHAEKRPELLVDRYQQFLPTVQTYGTANIYDSYVLQVDMQVNMVRRTERVYNVPRDAYPTRDMPVPQAYFEFDPNSMDLYVNDGAEVEEFAWHLKKTQADREPNDEKNNANQAETSDITDDSDDLDD